MPQVNWKIKEISYIDVLMTDYDDDWIYNYQNRAQNKGESTDG